MNRTLNTLCAAVLTAGLAGAQGPRPGRSGGPGERPDRLEFLALRLNLTDTQRQQASSIFTTAEQSAAPMRTNLTAAREALSNAVKANATGSQIDQVAAAYGNVIAQLTAIESKASAAFYAILTPEQKTLFDALRGPGGHGRRGLGGGGPRDAGPAGMLR